MLFQRLSKHKKHNSRIHHGLTRLNGLSDDKLFLRKNLESFPSIIWNRIGRKPESAFDRRKKLAVFEVSACDRD